MTLELFQVWIKWSNTGHWQHMQSFKTAWQADDYARNNCSTSGGKIDRIEIRERGDKIGRAIYDKAWR